MDKEEIKNKLSAMKSSDSDSSSTAPPEGKTPSQMLAEYNARKAKKATPTDSDKAKTDDIKAINEGKTSGTQRTLQEQPSKPNRKAKSKTTAPYACKVQSPQLKPTPSLVALPSTSVCILKIFFCFQLNGLVLQLALFMVKWIGCFSYLMKVLMWVLDYGVLVAEIKYIPLWVRICCGARTNVLVDSYLMVI